MKPNLITHRRGAYLTLFFLLTAQIFWSTVHGDGAVYAWIIKEISEKGLLASALPHWTPTQGFAEHPYLFFWLGRLSTLLFGVNDLSVKLVNLAVGVGLVILLGRIHHERSLKFGVSSVAGSLAMFVLMFNTVFSLQISQPSLDPLSQGLAFLSVYLIFYARRDFLAGLVLGLAFLTKGLELLPNLAAVCSVSFVLYRQSPRLLLQRVLVQSAGFCLPLGIWFTCDAALWDWQWSQTYWHRQFAQRFLEKSNVQKAISLSYVRTLFESYSIELLVLVAAFAKSSGLRKRFDGVQIYFFAYLGFNLLAFTLIKKDSSQHLFGVVLAGAILCGEALFDLFQRIRVKTAQALLVFVLASTAVYWGWYLYHRDQNPDVWTKIKTESALLAERDPGVALVVSEDNPESYGVFHTLQWYAKKNPVYYRSELKQYPEIRNFYSVNLGTDRTLTFQKESL